MSPKSPSQQSCGEQSPHRPDTQQMGTTTPVPLPQKATARPQQWHKQKAMPSTQNLSRRKCSLWRLTSSSGFSQLFLCLQWD